MIIVFQRGKSGFLGQFFMLFFAVVNLASKSFRKGIRGAFSDDLSIIYANETFSDLVVSFGYFPDGLVFIFVVIISNL